jgi:predicted nucleic acid-binding protein
MIAIDTSALVDHLRGHDLARQASRATADAGERLACSVVTKDEVLSGMRPPDEHATRELSGALD